MTEEKEFRALVAYLRAEDWLDHNVHLACDAIEALLAEVERLKSEDTKE